MLYLTCTIISSVDLAHYGVFRAKDRVSVDCGTGFLILHNLKSLCHFIISYGTVSSRE